jgi:thymidine phosphorylase
VTAIIRYTSTPVAHSVGAAQAEHNALETLESQGDRSQTKIKTVQPSII